MPFMLKIQWEIKTGSEADFRSNQETAGNAFVLESLGRQRLGRIATVRDSG